MRGAADRMSAIRGGESSEAEVGEFKMAVEGEEDIFSFEVSKDDMTVVEMVEGGGEFGCVEPDAGFGEGPVAADVLVEIGRAHV